MPKKKKTVWKSIKVPYEVHTILKAKAKRENVAMHKAIVSAILAAEDGDLAEAAEKIPVQAKNIDKALWYCFKLVNGVAMYKQALIMKGRISGAYVTAMEEYRVEQREKLFNTLNQIEERLKVDLTEVQKQIKALEKNTTGRDIMGLNDTLKKAMLQIINKVVE